MTSPDSASSKKSAARERFHDRVISLLLAAIWFLAALLVWRSDVEIPASMLFLGTIFFVMLLPAMKELVKVLDRRLRVELGLSEPLDDQRQSGE